MEDKYYTADGKEIPANEVIEVNKDGYVVTSAKWTIIDFSKNILFNEFTKEHYE